MLRIIIVDDEPLARQAIQGFLSSYKEVEVLAECKNGKEAIESINSLKPDLVFLDIQMPVFNGFEVIERLTFTPRIVFSTANESFALKAFETGAIDYLLKPYHSERFDKAFHRALHISNTIEKQKEDLKALISASQLSDSLGGQLFVRVGNRIVPIQLEDIIWLEAAGDYTKIYLQTTTLLANQGIGMLEKRLSNHGFMRVHRSAIVAVRFIQHLTSDGEGGFVAELTANHTVRISRSYAAKVRNLII